MINKLLQHKSAEQYKQLVVLNYAGERKRKYTQTHVWQGIPVQLHHWESRLAHAHTHTQSTRVQLEERTAGGSRLDCDDLFVNNL